jgi:hypothetical protein
MKKFSFVTALVLCTVLCGCSLLGDLITFLPVVTTSAQSIATVAAPNDKVIANDIVNFGALVTDALSVAQALEASGTSATGAAKLVAELETVISSFTKIETDVAAVDSGLSTNDKAWVTVAEGIALTGLEAYTSEVASSNGLPLPVFSDISGPCYGIKHEADGSVSAWANCDSEAPIYWSSLEPKLYFAEPQATTPTSAAHPPAAKTTVVTAPRKHASNGSFKRQWNALTRQYGHGDKQIPLTLKEHLHLS